VAEKGAIAVHGVSLTIAERLARSFTVALIPETLARTKLGRLRPGEGVNLEVDVIARYLESLMSEKKR
jgi:riboflavin synthase